MVEYGALAAVEAAPDSVWFMMFYGVPSALGDDRAVDADSLGLVFESLDLGTRQISRWEEVRPGAATARLQLPIPVIGQRWNRAGGPTLIGIDPFRLGERLFVTSIDADPRGGCRSIRHDSRLPSFWGSNK